MSSGHGTAVPRDGEEREGSAALGSKTARTLLCFAVLATAVYLGSRLAGFGAGSPEGEPAGIADLALTMMAPSAAPIPAALAAGAGPPATTGPRGRGERAAPFPVHDPSGHALDAFYRALALTDSGQDRAVTRIVHYGDSILTGDSITGAIRELLQRRFGDAGHGFVLPGRPWPWYVHQGVRHWGSNGWDVYRLTANPLLDGCLGLGGVAFRSVRPGARLNIESASDEAAATSFVLYYLAHPRGGRLEIDLDDRLAAELDSRAPRIEGRYHELVEARGARRLVVRNAGGGQVRVFGVVLERPGPGVVYDSLGVNGLHAANFQRFAEEHIAEQIRQRGPELIVTMLGTNESQLSHLDLTKHGRDYAAMLGRLRAGAPEASCLVMAPPDRATRGPGGAVVSLPVIPSIVARQRDVALAEGCGFFDTYAAMGGSGSAARWRQGRPALLGGDMTHPTGAGAEVLGRELFDALMHGYERWTAQEAAAASARGEGRGAVPVSVAAASR